MTSKRLYLPFPQRVEISNLLKEKTNDKARRKKEPQSEQIGDRSPYIITTEPWNPLPWWKISKSEPSKPACRKTQSDIHIGYPVGMADVGWRPLGIHSESKPTWCDFIELSFFFFLTPLTYGLQLLVPVLCPFCTNHIWPCSLPCFGMPEVPPLVSSNSAGVVMFETVWFKSDAHCADWREEHVVHFGFMVSSFRTGRY